MGWFEEGGSGSPVDVEALFDSEVPKLMAAIVGAGALVSVGTTSDGGAVGVTITMDGRSRRQYFRESEEVTPWLAEALEAVETEVRKTPASSGRRQRSRRA